MRTEFIGFIEALVSCDIDCTDRGLLFVAVSHIKTFFLGVVSQVVDVTVEVDSGEQVEGSSVVDVELALAAGYEELVHFWGVSDALRIRHSRDGVLQSS